MSSSGWWRRGAVAAAVALSCLGSAQALTLSRPYLLSRVGEPFKAEIDVIESSSEERQGLRANLATPEAYRSARLEAPAVPIQIEVLRRPNGLPYLRLTSSLPLTSNALDLLLDVRWNSGQLLRDFSVMVQEGGRLNPNLAGVGGEGRLEVQKGDTASELMIERVGDGISLDQLLLALLRRNPNAFVDENINRMKAGALLTLPTPQEASQVSRDEARRQIKIQAENFNAYRAELAARAPGGQLPKAERSRAGQLQGEVKKKGGESPDKLRLGKPKDSKAEDKLAQQRQAREVAERAAELGRNIDELGKIAAAAAGASGPADGAISAPPASAAASSPSWLGEWMDHPLAPVAAGGLIGSMVLLGLWMRRRQDDDAIEGLPPLNVRFDLDLPPDDKLPPLDADLNAYSQPTDTALEPAPAPEDMTATTSPPEPASSAHAGVMDPYDARQQPFQVRMELAEELWKLGQLHTSRALMEEVAHEATGELQAKAQQWLAERS